TCLSSSILASSSRLILASTHFCPLDPSFFFFTATATTEIYTLSLHDALPISMMYQFVDMFLIEQKSEGWQHYKSTALLRGYALSTLWVVTVPSFIVAVDTLGASLYISIAQGLGMAVVGTLIALIAWYIYER